MGFKGSGPKVKSAPSKKSVPYGGYIVPETGELIVSKPSWFNYETVIGSFRHFLQTYPIADRKKGGVLPLTNADLPEKPKKRSYHKVKATKGGSIEKRLRNVDARNIVGDWEKELILEM